MNAGIADREYVRLCVPDRHRVARYANERPSVVNRLVFATGDQAGTSLPFLHIRVSVSVLVAAAGQVGQLDSWTRLRAVLSKNRKPRFRVLKIR